MQGRASGQGAQKGKNLLPRLLTTTYSPDQDADTAVHPIPEGPCGQASRCVIRQRGLLAKVECEAPHQ